MWRITNAFVTSKGSTYTACRVDGFEIKAVFNRGPEEKMLYVGDVLDEDFNEIPQEYDMHLDVSGYNINRRKGNIC